ncbi:MAG: Maf family protein, partial [Acetobacteraceae bacterium]|nr:Maf family protein [Acetobacteraceae bacterium]
MAVARAPLILASASPRRVDLLAQIGITPDLVIAPDIDEAPLKGELPRAYARRLAHAKLEAAARPGAFALAADTVVAAGRRILPKPGTAEEARRCLDLLSGRRHRVLTAVVLLGPDGRRSERLCDSIVAFARLTPQQVIGYVETGEWEGKAGGYAIQGHAAAFIRFLT